MQLEFVAHSSLVYRRGDVNLICDPWLQGTAFDDGWALLSEPCFRPEDFAGISHIWISHEHPDHFSPRTLSAIAPEIRSRITVLFHESSDRKIRDYCASLGFGGFVELAAGKWLALGEGFELQCDTWQGTDDSWLLVRTPEASVLNLNDCQLNTQADVQSLRERVGPVDVVLTQFSISAWDGNPEDHARRAAGAEAMVQRTLMHARGFEARYTIPFASFIWCCHEENAYMNSAMVPVGVVADRLEAETPSRAIVMYPGDTWVVGEDYDSKPAIERYAADLESARRREPLRSAPVAVDELVDQAGRFADRLTSGVSRTRLRARAVKMNLRRVWRDAERPASQRVLAALVNLSGLRVRPARIWLTDHAMPVEFDLLKGLRPASFERARCDVELSSSALSYALRFLWGGESLQVNGRFRELRQDGRIPLFEYLWLASALNHEAGAAARPL